MSTPEWIKPGIYGAVIGGAFVAIAGFTWGGRVIGGTAQDRAMSMTHDGVVAAMVPVCLDMARTDPERVAKLALVQDASAYQRRIALMDAGWATVSGMESPDRDMAQACLASLDVDAAVEKPETPVNEA